MKTIAIDLGATYIKGAFFNNEKCLTSLRKPSPTNILPESGRHQVAPDIFVSIAKRIIDALIKKCGNSDYLLCSTQMHGFVLVDRSLKAISLYHSWMDRSAETTLFDKISALDYFKENIDPSLILRTGMPIRTGLPNVSIPSYFRKNDDVNIMSNSFMSIGDYVVSKLIGHYENYTSLSNAAGSGLYDFELKDWNKQLIHDLNIRLSLPKINSGFDNPIGEYKGMLVLSPIGDQQAALTGVWESDLGNTCISNIATGSQVTTISNSLKLSCNYQTRPFLDNTYIKTIPFIPSGRALNVLINLFKEVIVSLGGSKSYNEDMIWQRVNIILNSYDCNSYPKLFIDTDFIGSFSTNGGEIKCINEENFTVCDLLVGFMYDLVSNHINGINKLTSKPLDSLILTGGLPHKFTIIRKIFESKLNCKVQLSNMIEDALIGLNKLTLNKTRSW